MAGPNDRRPGTAGAGARGREKTASLKPEPPPSSRRRTAIDGHPFAAHISPVPRIETGGTGAVPVAGSQSVGARSSAWQGLLRPHVLTARLRLICRSSAPAEDPRRRIRGCFYLFGQILDTRMTARRAASRPLGRERLQVQRVVVSRSGLAVPDAPYMTWMPNLSLSLTLFADRTPARSGVRTGRRPSESSITKVIRKQIRPQIDPNASAGPASRP